MRIKTYHVVLSIEHVYFGNTHTNDEIKIKCFFQILRINYTHIYKEIMCLLFMVNDDNKIKTYTFLYTEYLNILREWETYWSIRGKKPLPNETKKMI